MKRTARRALAALLLVSGARAATLPSAAEWERAGFGNPVVSTLAPADAGFDDPAPRGELQVYMLLLRDTGWTKALAQEHFAHVTRVYAPCGLRFKPAVLIEADAPERRRRFLRWKEDPGPGSLRHLIDLSPLKARPVYYLFEGFQDDEDDAAFSRADFVDGDRNDPALDDSVFLPNGVNSPAYEQARRASPYSVAAHELWHVLTREGGHFNEEPRHIGNIWRTRSDFLRPRDCAAALANPLVVPVAPVAAR